MTNRKVLQRLVHPMHLFHVPRDAIHDFRNIYITDELELQILKILVVAVVGIWETENTVPQWRVLTIRR